MKSRIITWVMVIVIAISLFTACKSNEQEKGTSVKKTETVKNEKESDREEVEKKVVLKLSHVMSNNDPANAAFEQLAKNVSERSNGSIEIQVYANSELGSNKDNLEQIKNGANIISVADSALMADYLPDYGIMNGPFLYKSTEDLQKLYNSKWHADIEEKCAEKGFKILAMNWYFGQRHIISKVPVETVEDLKGMKIRVPSATMWVETMKALGATPTTLQWSEVYSGLEQGVVEAAEAPLSTIYTSKLHEAAKNISLTGHFYGIIGLEMAQSIWESLSKNQQTILEEEIQKQGEKYSAEVLAADGEWKKKLEDEGVTFYEVDNDAFAEKSKSAYNQFPEWSDNLYDTVIEFMK